MREHHLGISKMKSTWSITHLAILASNAAAQRSPTFNDFLRFSCSELNVQRIDP